jgi:uncharacterized cupin superfamily protein
MGQQEKKVTNANRTAPPISIVDSETITEEVARRQPGNRRIGEKITFTDFHEGNAIVKVGVWDAEKGIGHLENYPFTEYVLMISGRVIVTNDDGSSNEFTAGDTFVIPKGFTGTWDIRESMKKQIVQIGSSSE